MKQNIPPLLIFLLLIASVYAQCPVLCDSCPTGTSTCSSCFSSFQSNSTSTWIGAGVCPCPDGYFMDSTKLCFFCPVTCQTCTDANTCTSCMPGYEINQLKQCAKRYSNPGQWLTMDVAHDLTQQKLSKFNYEGFYLNDYVPSLNITTMIRSCEGLNSQLFLGMYGFDYNTQIIKSYFGLAHHDWVQIKFQFVAINRWTATNMILEINDEESYRLADMQTIFHAESRQYSSSQRHRNFCFGQSSNGDPDNLGFISVYLPHRKSMLKIQIRTDLTNLTSMPSITDYASSVYFGISNFFVRTGTCPTKCRKCAGPNLCIECISPYVTTGTGTCDCDLSIAQLTETGRCVKKCPIGYIFTKLSTIPESRCILCSLLEDKLRNCLSCASVNNAYECRACLEGYVLNSTGYCVESCPARTYVQVAYDSAFNINKGQCIACGVNCSVCAFGFCSLCVNGTFYQEGNCVVSCSDRFYLEVRQTTCMRCPINCLKCTSRTTCTQCIVPPNLTLSSSGSCTPQCNLSSVACEDRFCHASCQRCFGTSEFSCLSCSTTSDFLQNYKCVVYCEPGFYAFDGSQCLPCNYPCSSCTNSQACTSCQPGYVLNQQTCTRQCPLSFYPASSSRVCKKCSPNCKTCYNHNVCLTCTNNYILFEGKCVIATPCSQRDGFYFDEKTLQCLICPENCSSCYKDLCFTCRVFSILDNGKCVTQCSQQKTEYQEIVFDTGTQANVTSRVCKWKDILCNSYTLVNGNSVCNQCIFMNPMLVLLSTSKCSFTCPLGEVKVETSDVVTCQACPANCIECLSNLTCIKCDKNYVLNPVRTTAGAVECISVCPSGFTSDGYQCLQCKTNCKICDITGRCLECMTSFTLTSANSCANNACATNQYLTTSSACVNCMSGCLTCSSLISCSSCGTVTGVQFYLQQNTCRDKCLDGFWPDNLGFQCKKCPTECLKCASVTECTLCINGYYLLLHPIQRISGSQIGTCVRECPFGYFNSNPLLNTDKEIAVCEFCSQNCLSCFGPTEDQCLSCYGTFKLVNSRCVERCPFNKYEDSTGHCDWCHPSCMQCTGPAEYQCKTCAQGLYLYRSTCFPYSCPGSTYAVDYDSRVCELCQWGCQVCTNPYNCSVCTGGFYLYDGWCYLQCPANTQPYFDSSHQGYRCGNCATKWSFCLECSNAVCQRCASGYFLMANATVPCTLTCPSGFYSELSPIAQCIRCPTNCLTCLSEDFCTSCANSLVLSNGQCTVKCPKSRFYSRIINGCTSCSSNCLDCNSTNQCQNCEEGYYLYSGFQSGTPVSYCVNDCGSYRFEDLESKTCQNCTMNCRSCQSMTDCTRCNSGFTLSNGYCYQNNNTNPTCNISRCAKCLNAQVCQACEVPLFLWIAVSSSGPVSFCSQQCPIGMWTAGRTCHQCNTTCTKCKNNANDCEQCIPGWFLYQRRCYKDCPRGTYQNYGIGACTNCPQGCFDCLNATHCKTCTSDKKSYKGSCYDICPQNTFEQGSTCFDCSSTCKECRSLNYCTECKSSYVLFQGQCRIQCPSTHYLSLDENSPKCVKCQYPCATCKSQSECTTCSDEYAFNGELNKCVNDCGEGKFAKNASINGFLCTPCAEKCQKCLNETFCLKCDMNYALFKGNCIQKCPIGTFRQNTTMTCRSCSPNCLACQAFDACIQCHNQTVLFNGKCIDICPSGTFKTSSYSYESRTTTYVCRPCQVPCKDCNGASLFNCQTCVPAYYLFETVCLETCPVGYYATRMQLFAQTSANVNLVRNGDFSRSKCVIDWCSYSQTGYNNEVDGWIPTQEIEIGYGRIYSSYLGAERVLELAPNKNTCVKQLIPNLIAGQYLLQFTWAARAGRAFNDCQFKVYFGQFERQITPTDYFVHTQTINISLATLQVQSKLMFCSVGGADNSYGALIKDVVLVKKTTEMVSFDTTLVNTVQMKCVKCLTGCISCNSRDVCTACVSGWTLNVIGQCRPNSNCTLVNCEICEIVSSFNMCRKCINPYYLIKSTLIPAGFATVSGSNYTCVLNCPTSYYKTADFTCRSCPADCTACNGNDCSACKTGFFLFKTSCVSSCPTGYVSNSLTSSCQPSPCLYKNSLGLCQMCITPFLLYKGQCVTECVPQTYQSDNYCMECDQKESHCFNCSSLTTCKSCISGYFMYLGVCINKCPISYYQAVLSSSQLTCLPCQNVLTGCLTCQNSTICTQCKFPYFRNSAGQCLLICPSGTFKSPYNQDCLPCSLALGTNCLACSNQTTCTSCNNRTVLFSGKCISQCPNGFYLSNGVTCEPCNSRCFTCTSATNCTLCNQGFFLLSTNASNSITLSCLNTCPSGYFATLNATCALCKAQCLTCNIDSCLSCPDGRLLFEGQCLTTCPENYFAMNGYCLICNSECKACVISASFCLICHPGFIYQSTTNTCLKNCTSLNQYYNTLTYTCQNCSTDCETCYGPRYDQCLTCKDPLSLKDGLCSLQCPTNFYRDANSVCKNCDLTKCLTCSGSQSNCTGCLYPKVLVVYNNGQDGKCDTNCASAFYYDRVALSCKACSAGCISCTDASTCTACEITRLLYLGQCITTCPTGFISVNTSTENTCRQCPTNCATCTFAASTQSISCTQCITPLYLFNNTCYNKCPPSTFLLNTACQNCPERCLTCTNATICLTCKFPYVFNALTNECLNSCPTGSENINSVCKEIKTCAQMTYKSVCYSTCPVGTFAVSGSNQCLDCPSACSECFNADLCTACKIGFYMHANEQQAITCVAACPAKTYLNNKYCTNCPPPCETCVSNTDNTVSCLTCLTGFSHDGRCLSSCPTGFYPLSGVCAKCASKCLICDANGCTACVNSLYTAPTCESSSIVCTGAQFVSQLTNACENCAASCSSCFGPTAGECKACQNISSTVYYLFGSSCLTDCPQRYVKDDALNRCTTCSIANCRDCSTSSSSCVACASGYILFTNSSTTRCILSCTDLNTATKIYIPSPSNPSICITCDSQLANCLNCFYSAASLQTVCITCANGYFLLQNGTCTNACSNGFYVSQSKFCLPCGPFCAVCTSDTVCQTCSNTHSLHLGRCVSPCPTAFYNNSGTCAQCSANCRSCISPTQCTQCITPFAIDGSGLCTQCISGYFFSSTTSSCQICNNNCLECITSETKCTKCTQPLFLLNNKCFSTCPNSFYANLVPAIDVCQTCDSLVPNCGSCVAGGCLKCQEAYYLQPVTGTNTYSCISACLAGFYPNTANMICLKCNIANCLECSTITQCTKCSIGFYALEGSCFSTCPQGYAPATINSILQCVPCKNGCKTCPVSVNTCTLCNTNLQIDGNGDCVRIPNNCLSTQYLNPLNTCSSCHETCLTCFGGLRINCLTCRTPEYQLQKDNSCLQMCLSSEYYDAQTSSCKPCTNKYGQLCTFCDSQACSSCSQGVLASDSQSCTTSCTGATYQYNGACIDCPQFCKTCNSSTFCSQCLTSSYILYKNLCYDSCPIMTQAFRGTCRPCDEKCLVCVGTTTNCTSCKSIYKLHTGNSCVDVCPAGTFETTQVGVNNDVCQACMSPCVTCSISGTNCTSCNPATHRLYNSVCVIQCPVSTYLNTIDNTCYPCEFPCTTCISTPSNCTSCATGYSYVSTNQCLSPCTAGNYMYTNTSTSPSTTSCIPCQISNCRTCDATQCYRCQPNYYGTISNTNATVSCTLTCPDYFYPDNATQTCVKCKDLCMTCTSTTNCQKCVTPYFLHLNQCIASCPQRTYEILNAGGFKCENCGQFCAACIDNVTCTICEDNNYLLNGICYSSCPTRYYARDSDRTCQQCSLENCGTCTLTSCIRCADGFYGFADASGQLTSCTAECGDHYFENQLTAMCEPCIGGCKSCESSTNCQQCITPKSLFINPNTNTYACLDQCPSYYFSNSQSTPIQCERCYANCLQCYSKDHCYECQQSYTLFYNTSTIDTCITECPIAYYQASTVQGYAYCDACSAHCLNCVDSHQCTTCEDTHTLVNSHCVPHNCVNCDLCDETVSPAICKNCTDPYSLYKIKCLDNCPVYFFSAVNQSSLVKECQKCIENCVNCTTNDTCDACIPDYIFLKGQGCVNEAVYNYGPAANMSGFTSNITQTMAKIYIGTSVGPVAFGQMSSTYFNLEFTQFMLFHPSGGNPEMTEFLNSLQTMSLTSGGTTVTDGSAPAEVEARRRLLATTKSTHFSESFIEVNASIFFLMFAFLGAYVAIWIFQKFVTEACRVSCNSVWFYMDSICEFMQKRFKWIYFDFIMWVSYIPFLYFAVMQLKEFNFQNGSQGFSSILAIVIIATYPMYPAFICYLMKSHYSQISVEPGEQDEEIKQTLTEMSLSPFLTKVKRPTKNIVIPFEEQDFSCSKYFNKANLILIYYPLKYIRKFAFVLVAAIVTDPVNMVSTLIGINVAFIAYMIAVRPRVMPYIVFDLIIQFVLLAFEIFLLVYLFLDGPKVAMMSIVAHAVGFITANLSIITAIILNLVAYYKIFLCIKDLISHLREKAAERNEAYNKFEVQKKFLDPNSDLYIEKEIGKLKKINDADDTDQDDTDLRLSGNGRRLLENLGQKDLLLNGIDPIKYIKDLTKKQNYGIEEKQVALKYVNEDDVTDSDDDQLDENAVEIAKKLAMNQKNLALNNIHPVKFAKELTKDDAPLEKQYKKFDEKHVDSKLAKKINDDGLTDSDDDSIDENTMNIARNLNLNQKQLAFNEINPVKFLKEDTKKDAPLEDRYKKFDEKNVDKRIARVINEENATDSDDSDIDQEMHDLAKKLELNEKQLAFNEINPVKFFKDQTKKDAPLEQQYQKFDEKHMDKRLAQKINEEHNTDSQDDDSSVDQDAHKLARKLNLNEKQLAFNEINPMKFFKQETKKDAPLEQQYEKFDEKNVDRNLQRIINDDGDTDSQDDASQNEGYRIARDLQLNEKQLAFNNLNPVKVMQAEAKQQQKLKNIMQQFDQKDIDMKVARVINDNGDTSSEDSDDEEEMEKMVVARQLKLDEKQLAANNINPVKFAKEVTEIDPVTNQPKIDFALVSMALESVFGPKQPRKKLLDKELRLRNQMKREVSENEGTDEDEDDRKLSTFTKKRLQSMSEKQMAMQGLDPIKAVKKITKQAISKKMAKQLNTKNRVYDDEIPDFKVSSKPTSNPIKDAIRSTQQKLKQSTKNMLGSKREKGNQLPSEENLNQKGANMKLIDSESDQENQQLTSKPTKMIKSTNVKVGGNKGKIVGRREVENEWNDEFEVIDKKKAETSIKAQNIIIEQQKKQSKISLVDPNNKKKNFQQQFSEQYIQSEQSSQVALNGVKHSYEEDLESIKLEHHKSKKLIKDTEDERKIINLDQDEMNIQSPIKRQGEGKKSRSQLNIKPDKNLRQDQIFNQFEEFQDLGQVQAKEIKEKKYARNYDSNGKEKIKKIAKRVSEADVFEDEEISSVEEKDIKEAKFKRNQNAHLFKNGNFSKEVTESVTFKDGQNTSQRKQIKSDKTIEAERYSELVQKNKANMKIPSKFPNEGFEQVQYQARPSRGISANRSRISSDNESDSGQYSQAIRKERLEAKQRVRSRHNIDSESNKVDSRGSSQVVRKENTAKLRVQKMKAENLSENEDEIQQVDI